MPPMVGVAAVSHDRVDQSATGGNRGHKPDRLRPIGHVGQTRIAFSAARQFEPKSRRPSSSNE